MYAGQEAIVRTGHGTTDCFQIGKGLRQGCILSPCLSNLYAEYIMKNTRLDEAQVRIKIAGRNINNQILKYQYQYQLILIHYQLNININMQMTPPLCQKVKRI